MSSTNFHQPAARRPISFAPQIRFLLNPLSNEELINSRSSLPPPSRELAATYVRHRRTSAGANAYVGTVPPHNKEFEDAVKMTTLIPLVLQPSSQYKRQSDYLCSLETSNDALKSRTPSRAMPSENQRQESVAVPSSIVYTKEDWEQRMEDVKSLFKRRRLNQCASRCEQLLQDSLHDSQIQPIYIVYLCFYAAISLEQTARSLPTISDMKRDLFNQSLTYYQKAKSSISSVTLNTPKTLAPRFRRSSTKSSSSSNRSSVESLFAQFSLGPEATVPNSPRVHIMQHHRKNTSSASSIMRPGALRIQKKVSFSDSLPTFIDLAQQQQRQQQLVRSHDESWDLIDRFPKPPSPSNCPSLMDSSEDSEDEEAEAKSKEAAVAIQRLHMHLKKFEGQLEWHINSINTQASLHDKAVSNQHHASCNTGELEGICDGSRQEGKLVDVELKRRIARRKAEKWERKKFDPRRYQELCEKALAEVDGDKMCN